MPTVVAGYVTTISEGTTEITAICGNAVATYVLTVSSDANIPCVGVSTTYEIVYIRDFGC